MKRGQWIAPQCEHALHRVATAINALTQRLIEFVSA
jgi:hypothetical protein